jgi:putative transposase
MMRFRIKRGLRFQAPNAKVWTLERKLTSGRLQFIDEEGQIDTLTEGELLGRWQKHEWLIDPESLLRAGEVGSLETRRDLASYSPAKIEQAEFRFDAIYPFINTASATDTEIVMRSRELTASGNAVSPRTLRRWLSIYKVARDKTALVDAPRVFKTRTHPEVQRLFEKAVEEVFLEKERLTPTRVFMEFERLVEEHNRSCPSNGIRPLSRATFFRRMEQLDCVVADRQRLGRHECNRKHRTALKPAEAHCILDRIELDHTMLDVILIDSRTGQPLGRPWLTLAIDVYSKMIVGIYLTFEPPSSHSVLQCLKFAILPKDEFLNQFADIKNSWPVLGLFKTVVFDNGLDAHGGRVRYFCEEIGSSVQYCPSRSPWFKGTVERMYRTLNEALLHSIPGTTFSNTRQRGTYPSEKLCRMDKTAFLQVLVRWIVDVYHVTPHRKSGMPPLERWKKSAAQCAVDLPLSPADLDVLTARRATRRLHHYGVEIDQIKYNSPALQDLHHSYAGLPKKRHKALDVRYHDETVAYVDVFDPKTKTYLRVPAVDGEYTANLDRHTHLCVSRSIAREYGRKWHISDRRAALAKIREEIEGAGATKRRAARAEKRRSRYPNGTASASKPIAVPDVDLDDADLPDLTPIANGAAQFCAREENDHG